MHQAVLGDTIRLKFWIGSQLLDEPPSVSIAGVAIDDIQDYEDAWWVWADLPVTADVPVGVIDFKLTLTRNDIPGEHMMTLDGSSVEVLPDTTPPSVTISQAQGQSDPTVGGPIAFDVVFSEPVSGFEASDVVLAGSAVDEDVMASVAEAEPLDGTTYEVIVDGITSPGTVTASIPEGAALDAAGHASLASTSDDNTVNISEPELLEVLLGISDRPGHFSTRTIAGTGDTIRVSYHFTDEQLVGIPAITICGHAPDSGPEDASGDSHWWHAGLDVTSDKPDDGPVTFSIDFTNAYGVRGHIDEGDIATQLTVDTAPPTVLINQGTEQDDPPSGGPITFDVVFSEAVTGFEASDVVLTGTAVDEDVMAAVAEAEPLDGTTYEVLVDGITSAGTITASIPESAATDASGNASLASTSDDDTVTVPEPELLEVLLRILDSSGHYVSRTTADVGDRIRISYHFTDEQLAAPPTITICGLDPDTGPADEGGKHDWWHAGLLVKSDQPDDGSVTFSIDFTNAYGVHGRIDEGDIDTELTVEKTELELVDATLTTSNPTGEYVKPGDSVSLTFEVTAPVACCPVVSLGRCVEVAAMYDGSDTWTATFDALPADCDEGTLEFEIEMESESGAEVTVETTGDPELILDLTPPVISDCPADIAATATQGGCSATVSWTEPTAADYESDLASLVSTHTSGDTFVVGTTTVTYTATDNVGNTGTCSFDVTVTDETLPTDPTSFTSTSHTASTWSNDSTVDVEWSGAADNCSLGGYSILWDTNAVSTPNTTIDVTHTGDPHTATSPTLADGDSHYCHLRTRDAGGNWTSTIHLGPFWIDTTPPADPTTFSSTSHTVSTWSNDQTVDVTWSGAADSGAGLAGYSILWDTNAVSTPDATVDVAHTGDPHIATSPTLADGDSHYCHLRTRDAVGNWTSTIHLGPFWIDTTPPTDPTTFSSTSHTVSAWSNDPTVDVTWSDAVDNGGSLSGYSILWDTNAVSTPDAIVDVAHMGDPHIATSPTLAEGDSHYCHLRTRDDAGNWTSTIHLGPFWIDTTPPNVPVGLLPPHGSYTTDTSPTISWDASSDGAGSGVAMYHWYRRVVGYNIKQGYVTATSYTIPQPAHASPFEMRWKVRAQDVAGNWSAWTSDTVLYVDAVAPTVAIDQAASQDDPTNASPILFTAEFSEAVTGFEGSDVSLSGTAGATTAAVSEVAPNDGTTYEISVSGMTGDGTVIATIPVDIAEDGAGNLNEASTSSDNEVLYDTTPPTLSSVSIVTDVDYVDPNTPDRYFARTGHTATLTLTASEELGLAPSVTIAGRPATVTPSGGNDWEAELTFVGSDPEGEAALAIDFEDRAGNAGLQVTSTTDGNRAIFDITPPTLDTVSNLHPNGYPFEPVVGPGTTMKVSFKTTNLEGDILRKPPVVTIAGHSVSVSRSSWISWSAVYVMQTSDAEGPIGFTLDFKDFAGNDGITVTVPDDTQIPVFDKTEPTVTVEQASGQADPTNASPILFTAVFSEPVTGFETGDVSLGGGAGATTAVVSEVAPNDGTTYEISVSGMSSAGTVTVEIPADIAEDSAGNLNEASTSSDNEVTYSP
ncbi:HYR domain-containing protein [Candidatus Bipolaricaulota bacterium]